MDDQSVTDQLAYDVIKEIGKRLKWDRNVMDWFPYVLDDEGNGTTVNVMPGDEAALGLTSTSNASAKFNLETVTREFGEALQSSHLYGLPVGGGKASVSTLEGCQGVKCNANFVEAKAGPTSKRCNFAKSLHGTGLSLWQRNFWQWLRSFGLSSNCLKGESTSIATNCCYLKCLFMIPL